VINSTYRNVANSDAMPVAERGRLMDHVMNVDQPVRYALVLQMTLGTALAAVDRHPYRMQSHASSGVRDAARQ